MTMNKVHITLTLSIDEKASQVRKWFAQAIETELNEGEEILNIDIVNLPERFIYSMTAEEGK